MFYGGCRLIWLKTTAFQRDCQFGQQSRHLARDRGADARRVQRLGLGPYFAQTLPHVGFDQVGQLDAVAARIGKRRVGAPALAELGIHLDFAASPSLGQVAQFAQCHGYRGQVS